jgi:hypothetical protein
MASGNSSNKMFDIDSIITCRTVGGSGSVFAQGIYREFDSTARFDPMVNLAAITVDTTASQAISVTAQWSAANASNTISLTNLTIEVLR